jgi:hypothetical protein
VTTHILINCAANYPCAKLKGYAPAGRHPNSHHKKPAKTHYKPKILVHRPAVGKPLTVSGMTNVGTKSANDEDTWHEFLDLFDKALSIEENTIHIGAATLQYKFFRKITFRGLINLTPTLNNATATAKNLRGMVLSAKGRAVFEFLKDGSDDLGVIGLFVGAADQTWQLRHEIANLVESDQSADEKINRTLAIATSIVTRTAADMTLSAAHFFPWIFKLGGADMSHAYDQLGHAETVVRKVTDPDNFEPLFAFVRTNFFLPVPFY